MSYHAIFSRNYQWYLRKTIVIGLVQHFKTSIVQEFLLLHIFHDIKDGPQVAILGYIFSLRFFGTSPDRQLYLSQVQLDSRGYDCFQFV